MTATLPVGKLPVELLARILAQTPNQDPQVVIGPGIGMDCAVIDVGGPKLLALKSDPITFTTDHIGWYAVQVNANDIATTGASPRWMLITLLLPEGQTDADLVESISQDLHKACQALGISVIGGHTEITFGLVRPILVSTLIGEVSREQLITPRGAQPGDKLLLTKGVPIEATAILGREFAASLEDDAGFSKEDVAHAQSFLYEPGISIVLDARLATESGAVHAMHDPTEGGLYAALWELAEASGRSLWVEPSAVPVPEISGRICQSLGLDPLGAIASGALLMAAAPQSAAGITSRLTAEGILCAEIGEVLANHPQDAVDRGSTHPAVWQSIAGSPCRLPRPERDEIARLYES